MSFSHSAENVGWAFFLLKSTRILPDFAQFKLQNVEKCRKMTYFYKNICGIENFVVPLHAFWALVKHTRIY